MKRVIGLVLLGLLCTALWAGAQTAELTMWTFPEPDRLPSDLVLAPDGGIYMAFFLGQSIGMIDPTANTLVEWAIEDSPSHLITTDAGIFYTLPVSAGIGFLDPELTYTLQWSVPTGGSSPDLLVPTDQGSGVVNFYVAERNAGKIALFEPETIAFRSLAGVPRIPITLTPLGIDLIPESQTVIPLVIEWTEAFSPQIEVSAPDVVAPFREWTPIPQGDDAYIDGLALGGDGGIWFSQGLAPFLGVLVPWDDMIVRYALPEGTMPAAVVAAPDESIWFADISSPCHIGRLQMDMAKIEMWEVPAGLQPLAFVFDASERVWFSDREASAIYQFDPETDIFTWWTLPLGTNPLSIVESAPGTLWFVSEGLNAVGRLVLEED